MKKCVCVCVCVCVSVSVRPFSVKASSVSTIWTTGEHINDVVMETFIPCAKSLHRYFRMKFLTFLTSHFILFTQWKREKPRLIQCVSLRRWYLQLTLLGIALGPRYIVSRSASGACTHERGHNLTRKT